jgi:hypothetical protein
MIGKKSFLILAGLAILSLQFADCLSAMQLDHQSMQCCGSMPCTPANHSHGCCKTMPSDTPAILPAAHVSLHPPVVVTAEYGPTLAILWKTRPRVPLKLVETQQHSRPELYTLHTSLLI